MKKTSDELSKKYADLVIRIAEDSTESEQTIGDVLGLLEDATMWFKIINRCSRNFGEPELECPAEIFLNDIYERVQSRI